MTGDRWFVEQTLLTGDLWNKLWGSSRAWVAKCKCEGEADPDITSGSTSACQAEVEPKSSIYSSSSHLPPWCQWCLYLPKFQTRSHDNWLEATGSLQHKVKADQAPALLVTVKQTTDKFIPWGQHSTKQGDMKEASSNHALTSTPGRPGNIKKNIQ
jgi:hypothetical protein